MAEQWKKVCVSTVISDRDVEKVHEFIIFLDHAPSFQPLKFHSSFRALLKRRLVYEVLLASGSGRNSSYPFPISLKHSIYVVVVYMDP